MAEKQDYAGWKKWAPSKEEWSEFYLDRKVPFEMSENEYLIVYQEGESPLYYCYEDGEFRQFRGGSIKTYRDSIDDAQEEEDPAGKKKKKKGYSKGKQTVIYPRNEEQTCAFDMIKDETKTIKLLTGRWGSGKAQPLDTIIPTPVGDKRLGDLKVGDFVFDDDGKPSEILGVFPQGKQKVFRITFKDGRQTLCAKDHLWNAFKTRHKDKNGKLKCQTYTTETLYNSKFKEYSIPLTAPVDYSKKEFSVDPYIIGAFLGDGCCTSSRLCLSSNDDFIVDKVQRLLNAVGVYDNPANYSHEFYKQPGKLFKTSEVFADYPEVIGKSNEKRIPPICFVSSIEQRLALLQGLLDTDGTVAERPRGCSIGYASVNYDLAKDVQKLCHSLGFIASFAKRSRIRKNYYKSKDILETYYEVRITAPVAMRMSMVSLPRKLERIKKSIDRYNGKRSWGNSIAIINIEELEYETDMVCLYVDNDKHLYLTNDYIVTHNTMILVAAALEALKEGKFERIVWIRNNTDVRDTKDLGALPGEAIDKLLPFLGPFIDHAGEHAVKTMIMKESLKVEPLQFLRGRNFKNTLIICSEAENLTKEHIQLIIARAAEGSQLWFDGDNRQRDKIAFEKSRGIETMIERLKGNRLFGYVHLTKSERSETAAMADLLD